MAFVWSCGGDVRALIKSAWTAAWTAYRLRGVVKHCKLQTQQSTQANYFGASVSHILVSAWSSRWPWLRLCICANYFLSMRAVRMFRGYGMKAGCKGESDGAGRGTEFRIIWQQCEKKIYILYEAWYSLWIFTLRCYSTLWEHTWRYKSVPHMFHNTYNYKWIKMTFFTHKQILSLLTNHCDIRGTIYPSISFDLFFYFYISPPVFISFYIFHSCFFISFWL